MSDYYFGPDRQCPRCGQYAKPHHDCNPFCHRCGTPMREHGPHCPLDALKQMRLAQELNQGIVLEPPGVPQEPPAGPGPSPMTTPPGDAASEPQGRPVEVVVSRLNWQTGEVRKLCIAKSMDVIREVVRVSMWVSGDARATFCFDVFEGEALSFEQEKIGHGSVDEIIAAVADWFTRS